MRKALIVGIFCCFIGFGCTSPTQRIAAHSLQRGVKQEADIVYDLSTLAKQQTVDAGVAKALLAVQDQDADAARDAVENTANTFNKIGWLQIQHERSIGLIRMGQVYVWSQEGIFDILVREGVEAKKRSDTKDAAKVKTPNMSQEELEKLLKGS